MKLGGSMTSVIWYKTNYLGVRFYENPDRRYNGRPDRNFVIRYRLNGKAKSETVGWASNGVTPAAAARIRGNLIQNIKVGRHPQSLRELRKMDDEQRRAKQAASEEQARENITFGELMERHYLPWVNKNKKDIKDHSRYKIWLKPNLGNKPMKDISPLDLEALKGKMYAEGKTDATVRHILSLVRRAYNKAVKWGLWQGENPSNGVDFPKLNNARIRFLSKKEAHVLLTELRKHSIQLANIAVLALYTGMRLGEIFALKWGNIDRNQDIIYVLDSKNNEPRPVFIMTPVKEMLNDLSSGDPEEFVFKTKKGSKINQLSKTFSKVVRRLEFNDKIDDPRNKVTFHTLRHTFASWAVMADTPLYVVAKALGHKTTVMTQRYAHLAPKSQKKAFEAVALAGQ